MDTWSNPGVFFYAYLGERFGYMFKFSSSQLRSIKEAPKGKLPKFIERDLSKGENPMLPTMVDKMKASFTSVPQKPASSAEDMVKKLKATKNRLGYMH